MLPNNFIWFETIIEDDPQKNVKFQSVSQDNYGYFLDPIYCK